jgi:hypothetical protein
MKAGSRSEKNCDLEAIHSEARVASVERASQPERPVRFSRSGCSVVE